jgi:hypothetical protein
MEGDACLMRCTSEGCRTQRESNIMDIEDVDYVSVPYWFGCVDPVPSETCGGPDDAGGRKGGW